MKLRTLAIAVAMASVPFAAQADVTVSGDIGVGYFKLGAADGTIDQMGSEINFDASEKVGNMTYSAHAELEVPGGTVDEVRVGVAGGFGSVTVGDLGDNACGSLQVGGTNEVWLTHDQGGCADRGGNGIIYSRGIGKMNMAVSHRLEDTSSTGTEITETSIGLSGAVGPVTASIGYTDSTNVSDVTTENATTAMGLSGKVGPVTLGFRYGKTEGSDAAHGINALYTTASGLNVYGGLGTSDDNDTMSIGVKKVVGSTDFIFEAVDSGADNDATSYGLGMRHRF